MSFAASRPQSATSSGHHTHFAHHVRTRHWGIEPGWKFVSHEPETRQRIPADLFDRRAPAGVGYQGRVGGGGRPSILAPQASPKPSRSTFGGRYSSSTLSSSARSRDSHLSSSSSASSNPLRSYSNLLNQRQDHFRGGGSGGHGRSKTDEDFPGHYGGGGGHKAFNGAGSDRLSNFYSNRPLHSTLPRSMKHAFVPLRASPPLDASSVSPLLLHGLFVRLLDDVVLSPAHRVRATGRPEEAGKLVQAERDEESGLSGERGVQSRPALTSLSRATSGISSSL